MSAVLPRKKATDIQLLEYANPPALLSSTSQKSESVVLARWTIQYMYLLEAITKSFLSLIFCIRMFVSWQDFQFAYTNSTSSSHAPGLKQSGKRDVFFLLHATVDKRRI